MFVQIIGTLLIGGFITVALIGHVALLQGLFFSRRDAEKPLPVLTTPQHAVAA
jgi:hypothetical protein